MTVPAERAAKAIAMDWELKIEEDDIDLFVIIIGLRELENKKE